MDDSRLRAVAEIGSRLAKISRRNKDSLAKTLKQASSSLSHIEQPSSLEDAGKEGAIQKLLDATEDLRSSIVKPELASHRDKEVRLLIAACVSEIFRILAPEPPFEDKHLGVVFELIISVFKDLSDTKEPYFSWRVKILETVARCKCCVIMLDMDGDDLVLQMFNTFFTVVSDYHGQGLINHILSIMTDILCEEVSYPLLDIILDNLIKEDKGEPSVASQLAVSVIKSCPEKLRPFVFGFLTSCFSDRDAIKSELKESYHDIIFKISQCVPQMIFAVIPNLIQELLTDQVDVRIKAVELMGKLFSVPEYHVAQGFHNLFVEFLKRFSDISVDVRLAAIKWAKDCYLANPLGAKSDEVLAALEGRLLDFDDRVRTRALIVACDLARSNLKYVSPKLISEATERLRDKKISVRKKALQKLMEVYRDYCKKCAEGHMTTCDHFEQIPCKVLLLCYDKVCKEFRPQSLELVFVDELFPSDLPVKERARHWIHLFSLFNSYHVKALNSILSQKQRLRIEMKSYLSLRKKEKEKSSEDMQKRINSCFVKMSTSFPDPSKAEECFYKLNQLKDNNVFNGMEVLLDEEKISLQASRDEFLKMIGDKHPHFEFLQLLSSKCLLNIFSSEHVSCILDHISNNALGSNHFEAVSVELLLVIVTTFPTLLKGLEAKFCALLEESYVVNDKLIQILEKAGSHISVEFSGFYPFLKKICLEGNRSQSKHAIFAIASLIDTSEHFYILDLCKELVISMHSGKNVPTVLQSLGCISQHFVWVFEAQDAQITPYIYENIFQTNPLDDLISFEETVDCSASCKLKIYGLKTLVRSFLPHSGSHVNRQINKLLEVLSNMLQKGGIFDGTISSEIDKAHIRLAAAKSVLCLSRRWDLHISADIFHFTIMTAKDSSAFVRRSFLVKTYKLLREHVIPSRYACAFALATSDYLKELQDDSLKYMAEFIKKYSREAQNQQTSKAEGGSITDYPAYIVVYLIHILAHETGFPPEGCQDEEAYALFCSPLLSVLRALVDPSVVDGDLDLINNAALYLVCIFRAIKRAEDAVDSQRTPRLHLLADIGISAVNSLHHNGTSSPHAPGLILLPSSLYRINLSKKSIEDKSRHLSQFHLEPSFVEKVIHFFRTHVSLPDTTVHKRDKKPNEDSTSSMLFCKQGYLSTSGTMETQEKPNRREISLRLGQKQAVSLNALGSVGLDGKHSSIREQRTMASRNSEASVEKEQPYSSCDSVRIVPSFPDIQVSDKGVEKGIALKENIDVGGGISVQPFKDPEVRVKKPHSSEVTSGGGKVELLCLESESMETINDTSLTQRGVLADKSNSLYLQHCVNTSGDVAPQLSKSTSNVETEKSSRKTVPLAAKRKRGGRVAGDPSLSNIANANQATGTRRSQRQRV
ncbi:hypothetical protein SLE2022_183740 [Rubroshorea leprosula]